MQKHLKKYYSLFFLFLLVFPMVETQVHAFEHSDDVHCLATDKHFHELEHHCSVCDYTATDSNSFADNGLSFFIAAVTFNYSSFSEDVHIPAAFQDLPSRAPPVV